MMDSLSRAFQCVVCFECDDGLRCLPCGHSICGKCIQTIPSRQCPSCGRPLPANLDEAPVNYQLMSARDEITTIVGRLSAMENSFKQLNLNMKNAVQEKVEEAMDIERVQIKQDIDKLMAERQRVEEAMATERAQFKQHIDKLMEERQKVEEEMAIERAQFKQDIAKLMAEKQKVEEAMAIERAQFKQDIDSLMVERQKIAEAMAVERAQFKQHIDNLMVERQKVAEAMAVERAQFRQDIDKLMVENNRLNGVLNSKEEGLKKWKAFDVLQCFISVSSLALLLLLLIGMDEIFKKIHKCL